MCVFTYISLLFIHLHFPLLVEELPHCHLTLDPSRRHDRDAADARSQLDAQRVEEVEDGGLCGLRVPIYPTEIIILGSRLDSINLDFNNIMLEPSPYI